MDRKKIVWFIWISSVSVVLGDVELSCDTLQPKKGSDATCTCKTKNNIDWKVNNTVEVSCITSGDCVPDPPPTGYTVSYNIANAIIEYSFTVQSFSYASCNKYSCQDVSDSDEKEKNLIISDFNHTVPDVLIEPSSDHESGKIEMTSECLFKQDDIEINWYTVDNEGEVEKYSPDEEHSIAANCADTCNGEASVTLNIEIQHTEESSICRKEVQFRLVVFHKSDPSKELNITTKQKYYVKGPFPWWIILIIVIVLLYLGGLVAGIFILNGNFEKPWNCIYTGVDKFCKKKEQLIVIIILCFIIVGLGIVTVYLICYLIQRNAKTENDHQLTEKGTPSATNADPEPKHEREETLPMTGNKEKVHQDQE